MVARAWHSVIALLFLAAFVVQVKIGIDAPARPFGHGVGQLRGTNVADRLLRIASFFTIQSNVLAALVSAQLARDTSRDGSVWRVVRLDALFGITVTGVVYSTVLARIHEPHGWAETSTNIVFHYLVPIGMVLGWLLFGPRPRIALRTVWLSLIFPALWFAYTLARGALSDWYPYPFVDVATQGYGRVLLNALAVTAVFAAVAAVFAFGDRTLPPRPGSGAEGAHHA